MEFFEFLAKIDVIELENIKPLFKNEFMSKLENIKKREQREMFIHSYACKEFEKSHQLYQNKNQN